MQIQTKEITLGSEVIQKLLNGARVMSQTVGSTLGPLGSNVIIETPYGAVTCTKDGVTVAKNIRLEDPIENMAVDIIKQAASRTATTAGDGTTTSTVLAASLVEEASKLLAAGFAPIDIKRRYDLLLKDSLQILSKQVREVTPDKIRQIATIASNNDEQIGDLISEAYKFVGPNGLITLEDSKTGETHLEYVDGVSIEKGYSSPYFITDSAKGEAVLENPLVFITTSKLRYTQEIIPIMELAISAKRPLLVIADEVDSQALQMLVLNKLRGGFKVAAINAPSFGENRNKKLQDIAALTSATILSEDAAERVEDTPLEYLGEVEKVIISKDSTILINPSRNEELVASRAQEINTQLKIEKEEYLSLQLRKRLADLTASVAVLKVGAATETELKERKDRVDDALRATACALKQGYLIGGGTALARLSKEITIKNDLIDPTFIKALQRPLLLINTSAKEDPQVILNKILASKDSSYGYNTRSLKFSSLEDDGVIDPFIVVSESLKNAVSAASMIILSSAAVANKDRKLPFDPDPNGFISQ